MALFGLLGARADAQSVAIEAAALRSDRFRQQREGDWQRLDGIVSRMEMNRLRKISDADLLALPVLYRTVASSLSVARETSLDAATLAYLEALVQRAWFLVYGPRTGLWAWFTRFLGGEWSRSVRAIWPEVLLALVVMVAGTVVGWMLVAQDPDWYLALIPPEMAQGRVPGASRELLRETLFGTDQDERDFLASFAAQLFSHNAQIAILAFALGFAFGLPSILLLVQNTAVLGAMLWLFDSQGLLYDLTGWLSIHGTTELFAILLAGAAGMHIGRAVAFPGEQTVLASAAAAGQRAAQVMAGVVLMLLIAAMLEGFARQLVQDTESRLIVGGTILVFWLVYFFGLGLGRAVVGEHAR